MEMKVTQVIIHQWEQPNANPGSVFGIKTNFKILIKNQNYSLATMEDIEKAIAEKTELYVRTEMDSSFTYLCKVSKLHNWIVFSSEKGGQLRAELVS